MARALLVIRPLDLAMAVAGLTPIRSRPFYFMSIAAFQGSGGVSFFAPRHHQELPR